MRPILLLYAAALSMFVVLAPGCCAGLRAVQEDSRTPDGQAMTAVEVVSACPVQDGRLVVSFGSGVIVSPRVALTAAHVVRCNGDTHAAIVVRYPGGEVKARAVLLDLDGDVARLELAGPLRVEPARIGPPPDIDDRVCLVASVPARGRRCGVVERYAAPPGNVRHDALTLPGNSGSGVYDEAGRLVGIVTHYSRCPNGQFCGGAFTSLEGRAWMFR